MSGDVPRMWATALLPFLVMAPHPMYKYYHYVEIGLSDFDTLIEKQPPEQQGLSVEALPVYVDRLKHKHAASHPNTKLINRAVLPADTQRRVKSFYIPLENISKLNLDRNFRGTNRIGGPHPYAVFYGWSHLLVSKWVPAISLSKLLNIHQACRIGLLKLDVEGMDVALLSAYVAHLQLHPTCWADFLQFEVHPGLMHSLNFNQFFDHFLDELGSVGYVIVRDERPRIPFNAFAAYRHQLDLRERRPTWSPMPPLIPEAPKVLHLLMPCWNNSCAAVERRRTQWAELLPEWQIEVWNRKRLSIRFGRRHPKRFISKRDARLKTKYMLLSQFGGAFVDWRLNPEPLKDVAIAATRIGFQCFNPGPQLRHLNGMAMVARPFDPFLTELYEAYELLLRRHAQKIPLAINTSKFKGVNLSLRSLEWTMINSLWADTETPDTPLPCRAANFVQL